MRILVVAVFSSFLSLAGLPAFAQEPVNLEQNQHSGVEPAARATTRPIVSPASSQTRAVHKFFDVKNAFALAAVGVSLAGDGWSTQRALALPGTRELNPVARPFVSSRAGEIAYSGTSFALFAGGMYVAHRTHHHRWERIAPFALAGWEGLLTAWNLHLGR
jgi:hypothetical protein